METILFLAHTESTGAPESAALETLGAAEMLNAALPDSTLVVGLVGQTVQLAADRIARCGARRFISVVGADFSMPRYASDAAAAEALCRASQASMVLAPASSRWNRALPGVAERLGGRADTHVTRLAVLDGVPVITRWYYRQRIEAVLGRSHRPWMILLEKDAHPAWRGESGSATVEAVPVELAETCKRTTALAVREPVAEVQTIRPDADLLLVAGAGWTKKQADGQTHVREAERLILDFLKMTRASLGSSKSLVDLGAEGQATLSFLSHLNQVGQTGSAPRHRKGLATCCHGEEPHTVGWRFIHERRAISLDPNCGWSRGKADVLYVSDAFVVMRKVNELLEAYHARARMPHAGHSAPTSGP
jgi:electron transfer flavoprotein alpha subunit